ncbi:MAG: transposase [Halofilum sp. (in: g-proteobacteria)]|nr:transposase [Halofilum sp. (in: g-proteobacteria)]
MPCARGSCVRRMEVAARASRPRCAPPPPRSGMSAWRAATATARAWRSTCSRYVRGGPIANTRIVGAGDGHVRFRYKDHRDGKYRVRCLEASRFVEHLLWHVPEPGQHTVRHVGLYAHACRERRERCRTQIDPRASARSPRRRVSWQEYLAAAGRGAATLCPECGQALIRGSAVAQRKRRRQNSQ